MHCPRSTSLRRASPLSTAIYPATGLLQALYFSPTLGSPFHRYPFGYRCFDRSLPLPDALCLSLMRISPFNRYPFGCGCFNRSLLLSDAHLPFPPPSIRLQMRCTLSTSLERVSPLSFTAVLRQLQSLGLGDFLRLGNLLCLGNHICAPVTSDHSPAPSLRPSRMLGNRRCRVYSISNHCGAMWCTWRWSHYGV